MKIFLTLIITLSATFLQAQFCKKVKVYGFKQAVSSGVKPKQTTIGENNNSNVGSAVKAKNNMWFYLTYSNKKEVIPTEMYMNGIKYEIRIEAVTKSPIVFTNTSIPNSPKTVEMVPQTKDKIYFIIPQAAQSTFIPATDALKKMITKNEVVFGYLINGKKNYACLKNITTLDPAMMQ